MFIIRSSTSTSLRVYDSNGLKRQDLTYGSTYNAIDASANYLVYIDTSGVLGIVTYSTNNPIVIDITFPIWAIILISVGFVFIVVAVIIILVVRLRKRRLTMAANGYNRFNEPQGTNQYFPNNQPYNPVNPQPQQGWNNQNQAWNNQNQGWNHQNQARSNQNQGWNNQVPPTHVPNSVPVEPVVIPVQPTINPYQANQPSNWS